LTDAVEKGKNESTEIFACAPAEKYLRMKRSRKSSDPALLARGTLSSEQIFELA
jgi:hypothetical protein